MTAQKYTVWYCPKHGTQWPATITGAALASAMDCKCTPHYVDFTLSEQTEAQKLLPRPIVFAERTEGLPLAAEVEVDYYYHK